ncbi:GntR family transcriptional regulator [Kribbella sp. NPDC023972]|uniref:GntR family transcriptional regulator n=1 Tax=Kribbella sp. NPDC023972 TaxID=3154795 RepID=UPI0033C79BFC
MPGTRLGPLDGDRRGHFRSCRPPRRLGGLHRDRPAQLLQPTAEPASLDVADQLEIAVRTPIVHRQTVRYAGDEPAALENAYYPDDIVAPADPAADIEAIIDAAGYRRVGWIDAVVARLANPDEATVLGLDTGSPVIDHTRVLYSRKSGEQVRPVEYVRTLFAGNRNRLTYEYKQLDA